MALKFPIDTSVIKRLGQPSVRHAVEPLAAAGEVARARITDLEADYSARNATERDSLMAALDAFALVESTKRLTVGHFRCSDSSPSGASGDARSLTCSSPQPAKNTT